MKGVYPTEELSELPTGYKVTAVHELKVPGLAAERHLVAIALD
jgi:16S rRNA (guanine527-N7)-methyltransferase